MESGFKIDEGDDFSVSLHRAAGGRGDAGDDFEERGFAGSIGADDANTLPLFDRKAYIVKCKKLFFPPLHHFLHQRGLLMVDGIFLRHTT